MLPGTRVKVVEPPYDRPDLRGAEGKSAGLIPRPCHPLEYRIQIENEVLPFAITVLTIRNQEESVRDEVLSVNKRLNYCALHRLEICGSCGYDFRAANLQAEHQGWIDY
jgi:hypothetical protein